ncbi:hypothetical protein E2C01_052086 [Portunus trituberculatus]|uniref:Uncharacterized protein n=1 Tax=Portunus trituberculatus TaxID=210409 RepID=A0A5B7GDH5_PORTR|nr:hypothetical protein [Portunus trituberculatus]
MRGRCPEATPAPPPPPPPPLCLLLLAHSSSSSDSFFHPHTSSVPFPPPAPHLFFLVPLHIILLLLLLLLLPSGPQLNQPRMDDLSRQNHGNTHSPGNHGSIKAVSQSSSESGGAVETRPSCVSVGRC